MPVTDSTFFRIIQDTWIATLGFEVDRPTEAEFSADGAFTVGVRITGAWEGEVRLQCPAPLARLIAAAIFQVEADKAGREEVLDALCELTHIFGGNLKALLPQPVTLSLPSFIDFTNWEIPAPRWQVVSRLTLVTDGHTFAVTLLGNTTAEPGGEDLSYSRIHPST